MEQHLIVYAKRPLPGYAKTRLGAAIGAEQAAGVYARLLYTYLIDILCARLPNTVVELATASEADCAYFVQAFPEVVVRPQIEGDLGARMHHSFDRAFSEGADAVVLTGSDIPGLNAGLVGDAFALLGRSVAPPGLPAVVGPAADGGYYLLGLRSPGASLFEDIAWSTDTVLLRTEEQAAAQSVELAYLPQLADMDILDDYTTWQQQLPPTCPGAQG